MKVNGVEISNEQLSACAAWMRNGRPFSTFTLAGFAETQGVLLERYGMDESKAPALPLARHLIRKARDLGHLKRVSESGLRGAAYTWCGPADWQP